MRWKSMMARLSWRRFEEVLALDTGRDVLKAAAAVLKQKNFRQAAEILKTRAGKEDAEGTGTPYRAR